MSAWVANELISTTKLNTKTVYCGYPAPSPTYAGQIWYDTTNDIFYIRNGANNAWTLQFNQALGTDASPNFTGISNHGADFNFNDNGVIDTSAVRVVSSGGYLYLQIGNGSYMYFRSKTAGIITSLYNDGTWKFYGNLTFDSTQTVDGVDISALLLKTTKVTDLSAIWDKTTKIAYGDTSFTDQSLKTTDNVTHAIHTGTGWANSAPAFGLLCTPTASRAFNTVYHNLTGKTVIVYVCAMPAGSAGAVTNYFYGLLGATSSPNINVGFFTNSSINQYGTITIIVPSGYYYEIITAGTVTAEVWEEQLL